MTLRIKICGLTRPKDAECAEAAGADYGGVILASGSPRTLDLDSARGVFAGRSLVRCGVFVNAPRGEIEDAAASLELSVIQLHGDETPGFADEVRAATGVEVWKAVRPRSGGDFTDAVGAFADVVQGILLDGFSAGARGGSGVTFPWEAIAPLRDRLDSSTRLIVAGGLHPGNVAEVIARLAPDVVDVSSGVERSPGRKDPDLITGFTAAARAAAAREGVN